MFRPASTNRRGFTLIELLVVVSIIALLISLLLPALKRARDTATFVQCMSRQRQIMLGMFAYNNDNHGKFPPAADTPSYGIHWYHNRYIGQYLGGLDDDVYESSKPFWCPGLGAHYSERLGIGYNRFYDSSIGTGHASIDQFEQASQTMILADVTVNDVPGQYDYQASNPDGFTAFRWQQLYKFDGYPRGGARYTRWITYRHLDSAGVAFADGHVRSYHSENETGQNSGVHQAYLDGRVRYKAHD